MKKHYYNVRWGCPTTADVSFYASHNLNAKRQADKIARQLGVTNTPRTVTKNGVLINL